jgi:hypothetical protein
MHENRGTSEMPAVRISGRTAGEGLGRTARVFVSEESHRGILPMKHSNKDGTFPRRVRREGCGSRRTLFHLTRTRLRAGLRVSYGWASVCTGYAWPPFIQEKSRIALTSARPDLCGGHRVTGVPTAIANYGTHRPKCVG